MENAKHVTTIKVADLLQRSQSVTATCSLQSHLSSPRRSLSHSITRSNTRRRPQNGTSSPPSLGLFDSESNPNPRVLTGLNHPTVIVGTLSLPAHTCTSSSSSSHYCCNKNCFQFSDGSAIVCCDILHFDPSIFGNKIRVYAWNFIPFKRDSGFLEIIKWSFLDQVGGCSGSTEIVHSYALIPAAFFTGESTSRAWCRVYGALESVSAVSTMPFTVGKSGPRTNRESNIKCPISKLRGFLLQLVICECELCSSRVPVQVLNDSILKQNGHAFTKTELIYFSGAASSWYPVITKLIGKTIMLSGLKKKLVFLGKDESRLMYVTTEESQVFLSQIYGKWNRVTENYVKGKGECCTYMGLIKGVYMRGMVLELDQGVWLLLTDPMLAPSHGLRVGAIICVRNAHFVNPEFSWTRVLILGACSRTSITVELFSPFETRCNVSSRSCSMLEKFIDMLPFSGRLWVLFLVSSLKKKFSGVISEKGILGSNNKEGLVQMYANLHLPSSMFQTRHGVFLEFCKHGLYWCGKAIECGYLKMVLPVSSVINHSTVTCLRKFQANNKCNFLGKEHSMLKPAAGISQTRLKRRILRSKDAGFALLGHLKVCQITGRLQIVDATGGIDVIVPDLPLTWNPNDIFEVEVYNIIVDDIPEMVDDLQYLLDKSMIYRCGVHCTRQERQSSRSIFIHFLLKDATCRKFPIFPCLEWKNNLKKLQPGTYHLLKVRHKFPYLQKFQDNSKISSRTSMFVEATLLPWNLDLIGEDGVKHTRMALRNQMKEQSKYLMNGEGDKVCSKKQKTIDSISSELKHKYGDYSHELGSCAYSFEDFTMMQRCSNSILDSIDCLAAVRGIDNNLRFVRSSLYYRKLELETNIGIRSSGIKILLEFVYENLPKYQLLQVNGNYIVKHHIEDSFCVSKANCDGKFCKVDSDMQFLSLSFLWDECLFNSNGSNTHGHDKILYKNVTLSENQIEQHLQRSNSSSPGIRSDVFLYLPSNMVSLLDEDLETHAQPGLESQSVANSSQIYGFSYSESRKSSEEVSPSFLYPEGDLISIQGDVVAVHDHFGSFTSPCTSSDILPHKSFQGVRSTLCVHLLADHNIVTVLAFVSKHSFPVGFGPGVNASFQRVLDLGGRSKFMLTPVTSVVINTMRFLNEPYQDYVSSLWPITGLHATPKVTVSLDLISELIGYSDYKQMQIRCRVIAVYIVVLERRTMDPCTSISKMDSCFPFFDIPLAAFVLDDGSSPCCCWADADRAATLLRLHEKIPQRDFRSNKGLSKRIQENGNSSHSAAYHLNRILNSTNKVIIKNHWSLFDSCRQDLVCVTSEDTLSSSEENLLKFILLRACVGNAWTVAASVIDSDAVKGLAKEYIPEIEVSFHSMRNLWASDVSCNSPLFDAKNMMQKLQTR